MSKKGSRSLMTVDFKSTVHKPSAYSRGLFSSWSQGHGCSRRVGSWSLIATRAVTH